MAAKKLSGNLPGAGHRAVVKGMVLAAGCGSRLHPLTALRAKPAVPFLNRPLLQHSLELLGRAGVREAAVNLHHLPDSVRMAAEGSPFPVRFFEEPQLLGTGGGIWNARHLFKDAGFIVANGKIYFEQDLRAVLEAHRARGALATLVVVPPRPQDPFYPVLADSSGRIRAFARTRSVPTQPDLTPYVFTGIQVLEPDVLKHFPAGPSDIVSDVYEKLAADGAPLDVYVSEAFWCECSTPRRYLENSIEALRRKGLKNLTAEGAEGVLVESVCGRGTRIPAESLLERCVVWENVRIPASTTFRNAIITADPSGLTPGAELRNCVVTPRTDTLSEAARAGGAAIERECIVWPL